jgi:hypothetical protein
MNQQSMSPDLGGVRASITQDANVALVSGHVRSIQALEKSPNTSSGNTYHAKATSPGQMQRCMSWAACYGTSDCQCIEVQPHLHVQHLGMASKS